MKNFKTCGVMIDCSRNAVLKPETFKDILRIMSRMGLNTAMLYTEDTYEIDGYPYFGYMRGAYTKAELKDMDAYASSVSIELIPCIQTLGHLAMALRWPYADNIKDCPDILLVNEPETYKFIDAMLKSCRECFSTNKIHIGMDEAHNVGLGNYLAKHGYQNRFDILSSHLSKITEIAAKYRFKPMMWDDMFFRLASKTGKYHDMDAIIPKDLPEKIPQNVSLVYWDYSHEDIETYLTLIKKHREMGREVIFAGSIRACYSIGIDYNKTFYASVPALKACRETGIKDVFATIWGDDGAEVNIYTTLLGMQLYAEYARNDEVSDEHLRERFKKCTGYDMDTFLLLDIEGFPRKWSHNEVTKQQAISKQVLYQDVMLGLFDKNFEGIDLKGHYRKKLEALNKINVPTGLEKLFDYQKQLLIVLIQKCDMGLRITEAHKTHDMSALALLLKELETLYKDIVILHKKFRMLWLSTNKPFGLERVDLRFGGLLTRITVAMERLSDFTKGIINKIEELEVPRLMFGGDAVQQGMSIITGYVYYNTYVVPAV